jgi:hypothetical protein
MKCSWLKCVLCWFFDGLLSNFCDLQSKTLPGETRKVLMSLSQPVNDPTSGLKQYPFIYSYGVT